MKQKEKTMSRQFLLKNDWYDEDLEIFKKKRIKINPGLTVLVGCNGAGKTTMLNQIEDALHSKEIPVLYHSNLKNGEKELKSKAVFCGNFEIVAKLMSGSEGENILNVLEYIAGEMGKLSRTNPDAKELWFLFDGIDSGFSIDNIIDFKKQLIPLVTENNAEKDIYFIISANAYEFARGENCFDVINGKYVTFTDYEDYRSFILKSKEEKLKRYGD